MKTYIKFLRSEVLILISLLGILVAIVPHAADVLYRITRFMHSDASYTQALIYAAAIESVVFILIINGEERVGKLYAIASFICNLIFFHRWEEILDINSVVNGVIKITSAKDISSLVTDLLSSILISAMLSGTLWFLSELFKKRVDEMILQDLQINEIANGKQVLAQEEQRLAHHEQQLAEYKQSLVDQHQSILNQEQAVIRQQIQLAKDKEAFEIRKGEVFECNVCQEHFSSDRALNAHRKAHKEMDVVTL